MHSIAKSIETLFTHPDVKKTETLRELYSELKGCLFSDFRRAIIIHSWSIFSYSLYYLVINKIHQDEIKKWFKEKYEKGDKKFKYFSDYQEMIEVFEKDYSVFEFLKDHGYINSKAFEMARNCLEIRNNAAHYYEKIDFETYSKFFSEIVEYIINLPDNTLSKTYYIVFEEVKKKNAREIEDFARNKEQVIKLLNFLFREHDYGRIDAEEINNMLRLFCSCNSIGYETLKQLFILLLNKHVFYSLYSEIFRTISRKYIDLFRKDIDFQKIIANHLGCTVSYYESNALIRALIQNFDLKDFRKDVIDLMIGYTTAVLGDEKYNPQLEGAFALPELKRYLELDS